MVQTIIIISIAFGALSLLALFVGIVSPKGSLGKRPYYKLPGIMTPSALVSKDTWITAHKKTKPLFLFLSLFFLCSGGAVIAFRVLERTRLAEATILGSISFGLLVFIIAMLLGERAANQQLTHDVDLEFSPEPETDMELDTAIEEPLELGQ